MTNQELTIYIHQHIPITASLGAQVSEYDGERITLEAPLEPNINHRNTAFGGSIATLGILSGWALLFLKLRESGIQNRLVIHKSSFDFLHPIENHFTATSTMSSASVWDKFLRTLHRYGQARISIESNIESESILAGVHHGSYVALLLKE